jgi:hypothetical protein
VAPPQFDTYHSEGASARERLWLRAHAFAVRVLVHAASPPTEAGRWDLRKGGPACRGRWAVRAAASLGARWEAPRSSAPSSYLRSATSSLPLLPGLSVRWVLRVPRAQVSLDRVRGDFVGLIGGRRVVDAIICSATRIARRPVRVRRGLSLPLTAPRRNSSRALRRTADVLYCAASLLWL